MAVDVSPFGATSVITLAYGFAAPAALQPWDPNDPQPLPPGVYDATTTALQRLYYLWSRKPEWRKVATWTGNVYAAPVEQQAQMDVARWLANATGPALDEIGYGFALARGGLSDDAYRAAIRVRGASISSSGSIGEVLDIALGLFETATYVPWYPAGFALIVPPLSADQAQLLAALLAEPIPSGVGLTIVVGDAGLAPGWSYSDPATVDTWLGPRWDYSGGSDISATSPWGYGITIT